MTTVMKNNNETATETNNNETTEAPAKPKRKKVGAYPFKTKAEIRQQIQEDDAFALGCLEVIYDRQTAHEQENKTTKSRNARGFMSSHAKAGCELGAKIKGGEELTDADVEAARTLAGRYVKQLAQHFRQEAISADPALGKVAEVYSAA